MSENPLDHPMDRLAQAVGAFSSIEDLMICVAQEGGDLNCLDPNNFANLLAIVGRQMREGLVGIADDVAAARREAAAERLAQRSGK